MGRGSINANSDYDYVLYIDEAGDTGRKKLRPEHSNGSSEWFVLAGTLIKAKDEHSVKTWLDELYELLPKLQSDEIHFRKLSGANKKIVCEHYASKPLKSFVFASHKKNMQGYKNQRAEAARQTGSNWFYHWPIRLLLERISHYTTANSLAKQENNGRISKVRIEFSRRGGIDYNAIISYLKQLWARDISQTQINTSGLITWQAIDIANIEAHRHNSRAGLILPDILASATFAGLEKTSPKFERSSEFFNLIKDTLPLPPQNTVKDRSKRSVSGYSFKVMPSFQQIETHPDAKGMIADTGYATKEWWWEPVPGVQYAY